MSEVARLELPNLASEPGSELSQQDLAYFSKAIERLTGISIKESKVDLVKTRLRSRLKATGCGSYAEYRTYLERLPADHEEWQSFINQLTTNKTNFFREASHFDYLASTILPNWLKSSSPCFRVWSAAASTGEEVYTLAMVLSMLLPPGREFSIFASDIDTSVLDTAKNAVYPMARRQEIPANYYATCLDFGRGSVKDWFRIKKSLLARVSFGQHNLLDAKLPRQEKFDLVLCRNVLIYFGRSNIEVVSRNLFSAAATGGHLMIGHSETFQGLQHSWTQVAPSIFQKRTP